VERGDLGFRNPLINDGTTGLLDLIALGVLVPRGRNQGSRSSVQEGETNLALRARLSGVASSYILRLFGNAPPHYFVSKCGELRVGWPEKKVALGSRLLRETLQVD
jgi:hypothetical protein